MTDDRRIPRLTRQEFFQQLLHGAGSLLYSLFEDSLTSLEKAFPEIIRPPGALPEGQEPRRGGGTLVLSFFGFLTSFL